MKENAEPFERTPESWEQFMVSLKARFRRERRLKRIRRLAALSLAGAALAGLAGGLALMAPKDNASRLMARVPASGSPVFDSGDGFVETLPGGVLLIHAGGRS